STPPAPTAQPLGTNTVCPIRATAISVGQSHACALISDGTARCWGANYAGQLGDGTTTFRSAPVPVAKIPDGLPIAAGARHTCAARRLDDAVVCWGARERGPALKPTQDPTLVDVRAIAAGDSHGMAVTIRGAVSPPGASQGMAVTIRGAVYFWGALPEYPGQSVLTTSLQRVWPERWWEH